VLATAIRGDDEIKGISVANVECKISQFVDDTTMNLDGSQVSLERSFPLLDSFGQLSGLRVNCEKTEVLCIGSKTGSNQIMCPEKNLTWANGKVKALGVWFCTNQNLGMKMNYEEKVRKVVDSLNNWQSKRLTLSGKITVINALAAYHLVYVMSSLCTRSKSLRATNDLLFKFLWDGKGDKIKRTE